MKAKLFLIFRGGDIVIRVPSRRTITTGSNSRYPLPLPVSMRSVTPDWASAHALPSCAPDSTEISFVIRAVSQHLIGINGKET